MRELLLIPIRSPRLASWTALALLAVVGTAARTARAADPTMSECLSANESAVKLRGDHKLRQARDQALICAAASCPAEVRDACQRRVVELTTAIPTIVFLAKDGRGHDLVTVKVSMDGEPIANRLDGTPLPIDPGLHKFIFEAAGEGPVEQSFVIGQGQRDRRETIAFAAAGASFSPTPQSAPSPSSSAGGLSSPPPPSSPGKGQRLAGIVVGVAGVVGLGLGGVFGGIASSDWSNAKKFCTAMTPLCTTSTSSTGYQDERSATTMATLSTAAFISGGVLAAGGVVLFLTAPKGSSSDAPASARGVELVPAGGPEGAGLTVRGWF
jgi:hypothetical protein